MEAVALASTFATLIGFAMQVYSSCKEYVDTVRSDCPSALKMILVESASLESTIKSLDAMMKTSSEEDARRLKDRMQEPVEECIKIMKKLQALLPKPMVNNPGGNLSRKDKVELALKSLQWVKKKSECVDLLNHLQAYKSTINTGLNTTLTEEMKKVRADVSDVRANVSEVRTNVSEVKSTVNIVQAKLDEAQRAKVYKWLEKTNPSPNHNNASQLREEGTGQWLLRTDEWKNWIDLTTGARFLWVHGIPGAGKTILASSMADSVRGIARRNQKQASAFYYCYHGRDKDEAVPFLMWTLSQLCRVSGVIPASLKELYDSGCDPASSQLLECLAAVLTQLTAAYVVVDAVDESNPRKNLIKLLAHLGTDPKYRNLRLAATSREYSDIEDAFKGRAVTVSMSNPGLRKDIQTYIESTLKEPEYRSWPDQLRKTVVDHMTVRARGMFRYVVCQMEILADCDPEQIPTELKRLPETLDDTYERILQRIDPKHHEEVVRALAMVIAASKHTGSIPPQALVQAVYGPKANTNSFYSIDRLKQHCTCLIRVHKEYSVTLAHYTVREYLASSRLKVKAFAIDENKVDDIYCRTILSTAVKFSGTPNLAKAPKDINGDPADFGLYSLRKTRTAMHWSKTTIMRNPDLRGWMLQMLDPYGACFAGLRTVGTGYGSPDVPDDCWYFEWISRFEPEAGPLERRAAHLTMLVGFGEVGLVHDLFKDKGADHIKAVLNTKMTVLLPMNQLAYRSRPDRGMEKKASSVTVLEFYQKGRAGMYDTEPNINFLYEHFAAYLPARKSLFASAPTAASSGPVPTASQSAQRPQAPSVNTRAQTPPVNSTPRTPSINTRQQTPSVNARPQTPVTAGGSSRTSLPSTRTQPQPQVQPTAAQVNKVSGQTSRPVQSMTSSTANTNQSRAPVNTNAPVTSKDPRVR